MRNLPKPRGATLIEAMVAMSVLLVGTMGVATLHTSAVKIEGDSRRITRSTAVAEDLLAQIEQWPFDDPRLSNDVPGNDANFGKKGRIQYDADGEDPVAAGKVDHGEADLVKGGATWNGLPVTALGQYQRFWNVATPDDSNGNGVPDSVRVAVLVRWRSGGGWRWVVLLHTKPNPAEAL